MRFRKKERIRRGILALAGGLALGKNYFTFTPLALAGGIAAGGLFWRFLDRQLLQAGEEKLKKEAAGWLYSLMTALEAGESPRQALAGLSRRLAEEQNRTGIAWRRAQKGLALNQPLPLLFAALAEDLGLEELQSLTPLLQAALSWGADLAEIFSLAAESLVQSLECGAEVAACLAQRRLEGLLLAASPFIFVMVLRNTAADYMEPMLITFTGQALMLLVLGMQLLGAWLFQVFYDRQAKGTELLLAADFRQDLALSLKAGLTLEESWSLAAGVCLKKGRKAAEKNKFLIYRKSFGKKEKQPDFLREIAMAEQRKAFGLSFSQILSQMEGEGGAGSLARQLLENQRLGSRRLRTLLEESAASARRRCLTELRSSGARKETWLLFPMLLLLATALLVTGGPALLQMNGIS